MSKERQFKHCQKCGSETYPEYRHIHLMSCQPDICSYKEHFHVICSRCGAWRMEEVLPPEEWDDGSFSFTTVDQFNQPFNHPNLGVQLLETSDDIELPAPNLSLIDTMGASSSIGHGWTCGDCNWGRDRFHPYEEYLAHLKEAHTIKGNT